LRPVSDCCGARDGVARTGHSAFCPPEHHARG
jgi:hypothetical protein